MFTGIIEGTGKVKGLHSRGEGMQLEIGAEFDLEQTNIGESIAVNGCCLTITSRLGNTFWADLGPETLQATTLGMLQPGAVVNLERPLKFGERVGGHLVQGHVDGIGIVKVVEEEGDSKKITIRVPQTLSRYLFLKGSIAVDGVSFTVQYCAIDLFSIMVIPHTQLKTTFHDLKAGCSVNLEVDIIGKYVEKLTHLDSEEYRKGTQITQEFLKKHGF